MTCIDIVDWAFISSIQSKQFSRNRILTLNNISKSHDAKTDGIDGCETIKVEFFTKWSGIIDAVWAGAFP